MIPIYGMLHIGEEKSGHVGLLKANGQKYGLASSFRITKSITDTITPSKTKTRKTLILRAFLFKEVVPLGIPV